MTCRLKSCLHYPEPDPCPVHPLFTPPRPLGESSTIEQQLRDMLERMDVPDAQRYTSGDLVELANFVAQRDPLVQLVEGVVRPVPWPPERPSITCPRCGATSYNPNDIRERYCGRCHAFHGDGSGVVVREATSAEQFDAILRYAQQQVIDGAGHECDEWRHGLRCGVCGRVL